MVRWLKRFFAAMYNVMSADVAWPSQTFSEQFLLEEMYERARRKQKQWRE